MKTASIYRAGLARQGTTFSGQRGIWGNEEEGHECGAKCSSSLRQSGFGYMDGDLTLCRYGYVILFGCKLSTWYTCTLKINAGS